MNNNKIVFLVFTEKHLHKTYQIRFSASSNKYQVKISYQSSASKISGKIVISVIKIRSRN